MGVEETKENGSSPLVPLLDTSGPGGFHLICSGQIESVQYCGINNVYCRYSIAMGPDWTIQQGVDSGLSQISYKKMGLKDIVMNFPIDVTFKSTNPFGWPRLVVSVYGLDALGRDVVRGYGSVLLPTQPGSHARKLDLFTPNSATTMQKWMGILNGTPPEFYDSKFVAQNEGRQVTKVSSKGSVSLQFEISTHGMDAHGYTS